MSILHSRIVGTGKPLVILHGFLGMGDNWKTLANRFAEAGFETHLVDQRNHGRSFHHMDFSYEHMAEDLDKYLTHHNIDDINLLGHSMGGKTAMEFAVERAELVDKLVVADISPKAYPQHHQAILAGLSVLWAATIESRKEADEVLSDYVKEPGIRQFLLKNLYWKEKGQLGLRINLPALMANVDEVGKPLDANDLYHGPALFLKGEKSDYIQDLDEILIKRHFPQAEVKEVGAAGHWLHAENPAEFYQNVMNFL